MRILLSFCLLRAIVPWARADVRREGEAWTLEDSQLKVTVGAENAHLTVLDKASDTLWQQEDPAKDAANKDDVRGMGNNEDFGFTGQPQWFAAFGPKYRSACFALTRAAGFTYLDSGTHRVQIGLETPGTTERRVFLWGRGTDNADFAKEIWKAYEETWKN